MARQAGSLGGFRARNRQFGQIAWASLVLSAFLLAGCPLPALKENTNNGASSSSTTPASVMTLLAGGAGGSGSNDGTGNAAQFYLPQGVATDTTNHLTFIADTGNSTIRVMTAAGVVSTLVGSAGDTGAVDTLPRTGTSLAGATVSATEDVSLVRFSHPTGLALQAIDSTHDVLYVADTGNATIRKVFITIGSGSSGATALATDVISIAGQTGSAGYKLGALGVSKLATPAGMVIDTNADLLYVVDTSNCVVLSVDISPNSVHAVNNIAGTTGQTSPASRDGIAGQALFNNPAGIALDYYVQNDPANSNTPVVNPVLYVADTGGDTIRAIYFDNNVGNWVVITLAGNTASGTGIVTAGYSNGGTPPTTTSGSGASVTIPATEYQVVQSGSNFSMSVQSHTNNSVLFNAPTGIVVAADHSLYITDSGNNVVRRLVISTPAVTSSSYASTVTYFHDHNVTVTTMAGMVPVPQTSITSNQNVANALIYYPGFADYDGSSGLSTDEGVVKLSQTPPATAQFAAPGGLALDGSGGFYVADTSNSIIRHVSPVAGTPPADAAWDVITLAGSLSSSTDDTGALAGFNNPQSLDADSNGNVYVADTDNELVRKIDSSGVTTTLAGKVNVAAEQDGVSAPAAASGLGTGATFDAPTGLVVDKVAKKIYVADSASGAIRVMDFAGNVSTLAVTGATITTPVALALDKLGNLYVADQGSAGAEVIAVATGVATALPAGSFVKPSGIAVSADGKTVYMSDATKNFVRRYSTTSGAWLGGAWGNSVTGYRDGPAGTAEFRAPAGLVVDPAGNLLIADQDNQVVRQITTVGTVSTVSTVLGVPGSVGYSYAVPGIITFPKGLGMNGTTLFMTSGNRVLQITNM